jgi:hypothetical protein
MLKHKQTTYRQSTIRWPVLEFEPLNEALGALTIAATVCLFSLASRFPFTSIIALLPLTCVLLLGFVSIRLRLAPCTFLVGVPVQCLDAAIFTMLLGSRATISACRMRLCNTHVLRSESGGICRSVVCLASTVCPLLHCDD